MPADISTELVAIYLKDIAAQTRGSHRVKSANQYGTFLVRLLNLIAGTVGGQALAGYIERAQIRLKIATEHTRKLEDDERALLFICLMERIAFDQLVKLDQIDALGSINRLLRCVRCNSWFWGRIKGQRYCSEKCRVRHYQSSSEGKKYKREWARNEYQRNKKRDEESRRLARRSLTRR